MKLLKFVNRVRELEILKKRLGSKTPELMVIYGRRRVGKTELIKQFITRENAFYFLAEKQDLRLEARRFREKFARRFDIWLPDTEDFEVLFEEIGKSLGKSGKRLVMVIDEFPYWIEEDKGVVSKFQYVWDEILSNYNIMVILCGSSVGVTRNFLCNKNFVSKNSGGIFRMETDVLGHKSPLYGRRTSQLRVLPLEFRHTGDFLNYEIEDLVRVYAVTGGIPAYISKFRPSLTFEENIKGEFFSSDSFLFSEARILLREGLRDVNTYFNILLSIAEGSTKLGEISGKAYVDITNINKYLNVLINLGLVERVQPILGKKRDRVYKIRDNYFRFWVKFVYPFEGDIEIGDTDQLMGDFKRDFNSFLGPVFESLCAEFLRRPGVLSFTKMGGWWHKGSEIDLLTINEKSREITFLECKWKTLSLDESKRIIDKLKEKSRLVNWLDNDRREYFGVMAKRIEGKEKLREMGFFAFDLGDFESMIGGESKGQKKKRGDENFGSNPNR